MIIPRSPVHPAGAVLLAGVVGALFVAAGWRLRHRSLGAAALVSFVGCGLLLVAAIYLLS